ncbi:MAG TPA: ClpXP protease specificity-enhancing factor [Gammaproteobacteria bacterium]|nr:ClpXP protease specificity-enhancing factor [Gammaproteobacteria bacterium]
MLSNKPYLIRAFYEWIIDSACTPFLVINTHFPRCKVPAEHIEKNGEITLNISPSAIRDFKVGNDLVEFRASFSGVVHIISAPVKAVLAVYAQENQQGMFFDYEEAEEGDETPFVPADTSVVQEKKKPVLTLVE